jgi:hypothetical protein
MGDADRLRVFIRRLLCLLGHHRPERLEAVPDAPELELAVCEACGSRRMRVRQSNDVDPWTRRR